MPSRRADLSCLERPFSPSVPRSDRPKTPWCSFLADWEELIRGGSTRCWRLTRLLFRLFPSVSTRGASDFFFQFEMPGVEFPSRFFSALSPPNLKPFPLHTDFLALALSRPQPGAGDGHHGLPSPRRYHPGLAPPRSSSD